MQQTLAVQPYRRSFGFIPFSAWIWHNDTTTWWHRMRAKVGSQPQVYSEQNATHSDMMLEVAMKQRGFLSAQVNHSVLTRNRKSEVTFSILSGQPHVIDSLIYNVADAELHHANYDLIHATLLTPGTNLDRRKLDAERSRIANSLRESGYWDFSRDDISFIADTLSGSHKVTLTMKVDGLHSVWRIGEVRMVNFDGSPFTDVRPTVLSRVCHVHPSDHYSESAVRRTYLDFSKLSILRYVNVRFAPAQGEDNTLVCSIYLASGTPNSIQFELDGTNTAGDLGAAASFSYQHRNIFRGGETFSISLKGGYESLSGNVANLINDNYTEYGIRLGLDFLYNTLTASYDNQRRPEFTRIVTKGSWGRKWTTTSGKVRHQWNLVELAYVYLPAKSEAFQKLIDNAGPISYSAYTNHLILDMNYTLRWPGWRISAEVAGNLLNLYSHMFRARQVNGQYLIVSQPFEQYARFDVDYSHQIPVSDRSRVALHGAWGIGIAYGNSDVMPFEKRYYSGGANSVRGWSVRQLGPGRYNGGGSTAIDYFNQCGDFRLDASAELRTRLFWNFESAFFLDAGNVWTVRSYDSQPEGRLDGNFLEEVALAWGLGLRVTTSFVVLRLDWGFKVHDPSYDAPKRWPAGRPFDSRNNTLHFAVGYPF